MDPFLEDRSLWPEFNHRLIAVLKEILWPLVETYQVVIGTRQYAGQEHPEHVLEFRRRSDGTLVTLVDLVNPANRSLVLGRQAYLEYRRTAKENHASIVEIDLVLQGAPMLEYSREGLPKWHYAVTVIRGAQPDRYEIYTATLEKRLPRFRLPLASDDS
jgi:hypothetical protein